MSELNKVERDELPVLDCPGARPYRKDADGRYRKVQGADLRPGDEFVLLRGGDDTPDELTAAEMDAIG